MVALVSRRLSLGLVGALILPIHRNPLSLEEATDLICKATPTNFRRAVRDSGNHLLYRGEDVTVISILHVEPDLLVKGTYGDDPFAVAYFEKLEAKLKHRLARPSRGHIGTSRPQDAAVWGQLVSVWPLGTEINYAWPRSTNTIYPESDQNDLVIDDRLADALERGTEVLFASSFHMDSYPQDFMTEWRAGTFIAVPSRFDQDLIKMLQKRNYGLIS